MRKVHSDSFGNLRDKSNRWWIPSRSYIRLRANLTNGDGTLINTSSLAANGGDKAPNMGVCGNLFQSMEFKIAQKVVSRISDRVAQVDALYSRLNYSKSQLDAWGQSTNWWDPDYKFRNNQIAVDGLELDDGSSYPKFIDESPSTETATQVGFDIAVGPNQVAYTLATRLLTFSVNGGNAINISNNQILHVGDVVVLPEGEFKILEILTSLTANALQTDGNAANFVARDMTDGDLFVRGFQQADNKSPKRSNLEFIWKPPLGIFNCPYALPAGR